MLALLLTLLVGLSAAAAIGTYVSGLFWLTVVALALLLLTGAVGLARMQPPADETDLPRTAVRAGVVGIESRRRPERRATATTGRELGRAA